VGSFAALTVASAKMDKTLKSGWWPNRCSCNNQFGSQRGASWL